MKRLKDSSDVPKARLGILPKTFSSSKKKTRLHTIFPQRNEYSRLRQRMSSEKREFVVDCRSEYGYGQRNFRSSFLGETL